jgi:hypothetical protein
VSVEKTPLPMEVHNLVEQQVSMNMGAVYISAEQIQEKLRLKS